MGISVVQQQNFASSSAGTSFAFTPTAPATAGNLLAVVACYRAASGGTNGPTISSIADTATGGSNSYSLAKSSSAASQTSEVDVWFVDPANSKSTVGTVTITFSESCDVGVTWYEVSGIASSPHDSTADAASSGASTGPTVTTGTLAQASEILLGGIDWQSGSITESAAPASPWTNAAVQLPSNRVTTRSSYQITSATTAVTYSDTLSASATWAICVACFKGAAATVFLPGTPFGYLGQSQMTQLLGY